MFRKQKILVFCAHSDDQILGPGGALAKYAKEGKKIYTIILSYGEASLAWLKPEIAIKTRVKEAKNADKIIGGKGITFLGLKEGKFIENLQEKKIEKKIIKIIRKRKPIKIFTHSSDDPHPDHRAAHKIIINILDKMRYKCDVFSFDVWNPLTGRKKNLPRLYVDITETFSIKTKALKAFQSQKIAIFTLLWSVYLRAVIHGLHINKRFAERFFKIR
jgi:LmbE family N-acetylglucosaminyl deacetylase